MRGRGKLPPVENYPRRKFIPLDKLAPVEDYPRRYGDCLLYEQYNTMVWLGLFGQSPEVICIDGNFARG